MSASPPGPDLLQLFPCPRKDVAGQTISAIVGSARPPGQPLAGFRIVGNVFFDNANCTGLAWILANDAVAGAFFDEFHAAMIVGDQNIDPDERLLYLPDTNVPPSQHTVNSQMTEKCDPNTTTRDFVPALLFDPDLHTTFPKPYTLDLN